MNGNAVAGVGVPAFINADTRDFLEQWFRQCPGMLLEVRCLGKNSGLPNDRAWFRDAKEARKYIGLKDVEGYDVYVGVNPRSREGGEDADVAGCYWLWSDIDVGMIGHAKPGAYETFEEARRAVEPLRPTMVVNTGGGLHAWWALESPAPWERCAEAMRRIAHAVNGDEAVITLGRILRVPGTRNRKPTQCAA